MQLNAGASLPSPNYYDALATFWPLQICSRRGKDVGYAAGMNKRRRIAGFALLTGAAIGLVFYVTRPREPVYQGRVLSEWLAELNGYDPRQQKTHEKATEAVRHIGTNAIPRLRKMLRVDFSPTKERINRLLDKQSVIEFRFNYWDENAFEVACRACEALGPAAKELLPDFRPQVFDIIRSDCFSASRALAAIGPEAVPLLVEALTNRDGAIRVIGAYGLFLMGTNAQAAVPQLAMAARNASGSDTRRYATLALANSGQDTQTWLPMALELVRNTNSYTRASTVFLLGQIGNRAEATVPALLTALADSDEHVRKNAAEALKKIDPEAAAKAGVK